VPWPSDRETRKACRAIRPVGVCVLHFFADLLKDVVLKQKSAPRR
jgi:hypothetical protein